MGSSLRTTMGTIILRVAHSGQFYPTLHLNRRMKLIELLSETRLR